jgi:hypothetical protein
MTDVIRVDPAILHHSAREIENVANSLRLLGLDLSGSLSQAPSYDGQFGPGVSSIGGEASARARAVADRLQTLVQQLDTKADEFQQADLDGVSSLGLYLPPQPPDIDLAELFEQIPWWVVLILGILPFGDAVGLLEELVNSLSGRGVSRLNLWLSLFGLAADTGWLDGLLPDPVDAVNVGLAVVKGAVRTLGRIPPAAEKVIIEALQAAWKNPDEVGRIGRLLQRLAENPQIAARLFDDTEGLALALARKDGPELLEQFAKQGENILGHMDEAQALRVSDMATEYGVDIHVAGRLADTPADRALRELAAKEVNELQAQGVPELEAQFRVAEKYDIDFFQARVSSGKPEVDVFIQQKQWAELTKDQQTALETELDAIFNPEGNPLFEVDFYQTHKPLDPIQEGLPPGRYEIPDPRTNVPPGSLQFAPDGSLSHPPMGKSPALQEIFGQLGLPWPP